MPRIIPVERRFPKNKLSAMYGFREYVGLCWLLGLVGLSAISSDAAPVVFKSVLATHSGGGTEALQKTIDGSDVSPDGWCLASHYAEPQSAVFIAAEPIDADLLNLTMFFMSGRPNASFAHFSVAYTIDPNPSLESLWEDLPILNFGATYYQLEKGQGNRLLAAEEPAFRTGTIPDNLYWISARTRGKAITGFRITVFPVLREADATRSPVMSWSPFDGDFVLTEFSAEVLSSTTNVALGAPVSATHPLFSQPYPESERAVKGSNVMSAEALTDGWPSTIAHPASSVMGENFHFEIDLGQIREIDHIGLRQRGDAFNLDRFGKMRVQIFAENPMAGAAPTWQVLHRPDGSYPNAGAVDILRSQHGRGNFRGRYLRLSSESQVACSPMLAEVEVYETRTAQITAAMADEQPLALKPPIRVPPGSLRLAIHLDFPQSGKPFGKLYRWRLRGNKDDWQFSNSKVLELPSPPPGPYVLEVQAAHSDGEWDASRLIVPLEILIPFTKSRMFFWIVVLGTLAVGGLLVWGMAARRIARLHAQAALAAERSRIARDMHDDVGARLSQISFMLNALDGTAQLPRPAQDDVRTIRHAANEAIGSLDEVVWTVNPKNDRLGPLCERLCSHAARYLRPLGITCRIHSQPTWPDVIVQASTRHEVSMAFKEALQNVVKHAAASEVELSLHIIDQQLEIHIADNGRGIPEQGMVNERNGLKNMQARLDSLGGTCVIRARASGGTEVLMQLPLAGACA